MIQLFSPNGKLTAVINPLGAALSELWREEVQVCGAPDQYSGVVLFPWPNRIYGGSWRWQEQGFQLPVNDFEQNAALHGLVFDKVFEFSQESEANCSGFLVLEPTPGFPFEAKLKVEFSIQNTQLNIRYSVTNHSADAMPFAIGFHPYFRANEDSILVTDIGNLALEGGHVDYTLGPDLSVATLKTKNYELQLVGPDTHYMHVFTNRYSNPDFIWFAIEPQTSPVDALNTGIGITELGLGETKVFDFSLKVD